MRLIDRPLLGRLKVGFFAGICAAAGVIAFELLFADFKGGRALNKYSATGDMPLWPTVAAWAVALPLVGTLTTSLLPLYRRRYGGVVVGVVLLAVFLLSSILVWKPRGFTPRVPSVHAIVLLCVFFFVAGLFGHLSRDGVLGEESPDRAPDEAS
jgi:hypothetical protein